jgi:hypothetical protein
MPNAVPKFKKVSFLQIFFLKTAISNTNGYYLRLFDSYLTQFLAKSNSSY